MTRWAYRAGRAFDGDRALPAGAVVLVDGSTIVGVEPATTPVPDGWQLVELPGTTLLPGLIDTHVHLCGDDGPRALDKLLELDDDQVDRIVERALHAQLAAGITAVRDLGDARWAVVDRHRGRTGPTVVAAGPPITIHGGHCWFLGGEAEGAGALRAAVAERAERGVDVIKVMAGGGIMTAGSDVLEPQYTVEDLRIVVETAHATGLPVTAHAHATTAVESCLAAGVDGIEHCTCLTSSGIAAPGDLADRLAAAGIIVCPTLGRHPGAQTPPQVQAMLERTGMAWQARLALVGEQHRAGVRLISGADSGISPGKPHGLLPHAVADMIDAGLPVAAALGSATGEAADACGLGARTGRLRPGLAADLLLVDGDALTDIGALARIRTVVCRGRQVQSLTGRGHSTDPRPPTPRERASWASA